jgi:hypothetical protein|tara:strand:- start:1298 stop:1510 length:213 start_codon:yes stop_codon:yes gene_type:complete
MPYDTDDRFDVWMKSIIETAWLVIDEYEEYLLNRTNDEFLSKKMKQLYDQLPVDPNRSKQGKDKNKKDPL